MLHHRVYFAPEAAPLAFEDVSATGIAACEWELGVLAFEREAWITRVLVNPNGADLEGYCADAFSGAF